MNVLYEQVTLGPPSNLPWGDDFKTVIYLSHQEKTNVRSDRGAHEIYHDGWLPGEQTILTLAWLFPFLMIFRIIEINLNLPLSPLILLALVILVLRRPYTLPGYQNGDG